MSMSLNCNLSGLSSRLRANFKLKKSKESINGFNSVRKWRRKLVFLWVFGIMTLGSFWLFWGLDFGILGMKEGISSSCEEKVQILRQHFNVSKKQLHALASLFSESDQVLSSLLLNL